MSKTFKDSEDYINAISWGSDFPVGKAKYWVGGKEDIRLEGVDYKDQQHDTVLNAWYFGELNFCGCGLPEDELALMREVLSALAQRSFENNCGPRNNYKETLEQWNSNTIIIKAILGDNERFEHHYLQWLDSLDLLKHGSTVYGSWPNEKGYSVLKMLIENENNTLETF